MGPRAQGPVVTGGDKSMEEENYTWDLTRGTEGADTVIELEHQREQETHKGREQIPEKQ